MSCNIIVCKFYNKENEIPEEKSIYRTISLEPYEYRNYIGCRDKVPGVYQRRYQRKYKGKSEKFSKEEKPRPWSNPVCD